MDERHFNTAPVLRHTETGSYVDNPLCTHVQGYTTRLLVVFVVHTCVYRINNITPSSATSFRITPTVMNKRRNIISPDNMYTHACVRIFWIYIYRDRAPLPNFPRWIIDEDAATTRDHLKFRDRQNRLLGDFLGIKGSLRFRDALVRFCISTYFSLLTFYFIIQGLLQEG